MGSSRRSFRARAAAALALGILIAGPGAAGRAGASDQAAPASVPTPRQIWDRFRTTLPPLDARIEKDEIIPSDTDPRIKLRRIEVKFYSQEIDGKAWGHPCVVFLPAERKVYDAARRRGKIVIVGQRSWDGLATGPWRDPFLGNYGEPIAARTGYPTMILPSRANTTGPAGRRSRSASSGRSPRKARTRPTTIFSGWPFPTSGRST